MNPSSLLTLFHNIEEEIQKGLVSWCWCDSHSCSYPRSLNSLLLAVSCFICGPQFKHTYVIISLTNIGYGQYLMSGFKPIFSCRGDISLYLFILSKCRFQVNLGSSINCISSSQSFKFRGPSTLVFLVNSTLAIWIGRQKLLLYWMTV